jgi:protein-tyrosine phosphatase
MLEAAQRIGVEVVFATPHIYFYNIASQVLALADQKLAQLRKALRQRNLSIQIESGFEVFLQPSLPSPSQLVNFTLGGKGKFILVELALGQIPYSVEKSRFDLILNGVTPILAHPERNLISSSQLVILEKLVDQGVRLQIEAASLVGLNGPELRKNCQLLLKKELVSFVASDAHRRQRNFVPMQKAYQLIQKQFSEQKAQQLFSENQREILSVTGVQTHLKFQTQAIQREQV